MNGILLVNKAQGYTSMDCCAIVRRLFHEKKVGHTGTLDPNATGVLPICIGKATKLIEYMDNCSKTYIAGFTLGLSSDTEDIWGELQKHELSSISRDQIKALLPIGDVEQIPPMYSAKKINGQKLYDIAREGRVVERKANLIHVYRCELLEFDGVNGKLEIECSRGTYVRTICADLGKALGCGCVMTSLVRSETSGFKLDECIGIEELKSITEPPINLLVPMDRAMSKYPRLDVSDECTELIHNGNIRFKEYLDCDNLSGIVSIYNSNKLIAILKDGDLSKVFNENI